MFLGLICNSISRCFFFDLPKGGHSDNGVPKGCRNGSEVSFVDIFLSIEHDSGKDDDGHG